MLTNNLLYYKKIPIKIPIGPIILFIKISIFDVLFLILFYTKETPNNILSVH